MLVKFLFYRYKTEDYKANWLNDLIFLRSPTKKWLESYKLADLTTSQLRGLSGGYTIHRYFTSEGVTWLDKCGLVLNIILNHFNPSKSNFKKLFQPPSFS